MSQSEDRDQRAAALIAALAPERKGPTAGYLVAISLWGLLFALIGGAGGYAAGRDSGARQARMECIGGAR